MKATMALLGASLLLALLLTGASRPLAQPGLGLIVRPGDGGLLVARVEPGSSAEAGGLRAGDLVVGIGSMQVGTPAELAREVAAHRGDTYGLQVRRDGNVVEALIPRDPADPRFRGVEVARRQCAAFCLMQETRRWYECGCVVAEGKTCNGCSARR